MKNSKTIIIAEAGVNHNGLINNAMKLIDVAANAKADFIKFQTFNTDKLTIKKARKANYQLKTSDKKETQFQMLKKLEIKKNDHFKLLKYCNKRKVKFLTSLFDNESINIINLLNLKFLKIPSGEITNLPYLEKIGKLKKTIFLSTGMSFMYEIEKAVEILVKNGTNKSNIYVLHCNTEYPTPFEDVNLNAIKTIKNKLKLKVGYSDHTLGNEVSIAAVAMGCEVIEKHITLNKLMKGPDHKSSMNPNEFIKFVKMIRNVEVSFGSKIKKPSKSEIKNIKSIRKSIYASKIINKGEIFTKENISIKRPFNGVNPMKINTIYGKKAKKKYFIDDLISK